MTPSTRIAVRHCALSALLLSVLVTWEPSPAAQAVTFKSAANLVVETVSVRDTEGRPIEGLTAADFILTEDGEPQQLAFAEFQRLPPLSPGHGGDPNAADLRAAADASMRATIATASSDDARYRDHRLLVLYFDQTSMAFPDQMRAFDAALHFIRTDRDASTLVAIMSFQGAGVRVRCDFTNSRNELEEAMERLITNDDANHDGIPDTPDTGTAFGQDDSEFSIFSTDRQLSALQTAVTMLRPLGEQKALVYFSGGLRFAGLDNQAQLRATTNAARRADVTIHAIDARGLTAMAPLGNATQGSPGGDDMFTGRGATQASDNVQKSLDALHAVAHDTGGTTLFDDGNLARGITRAAASIDSYYMLGYYSSHAATDGRLHRVHIALRDGRRAQLTYREGYYAEKTFSAFTAVDRERQLEDALMLDNPITDITVALQVNVFRLTTAEYFVPVDIRIPGHELALAQKGGASHTRIDFVGEVKDSYGVTRQNVRDSLDIPLDDRAAARMAVQPVQYETGFTLLPGSYVIKVLARDNETGRIGTFQYAFTIPNLNRIGPDVALSSVVLSHQRLAASDALFTVRQKLPTDAVNPLLVDGAKVVPNVTRVFSRTATLSAYLQAYLVGVTTARPLVATLALYREGAKVAEAPPALIAAAPQPRSSAVPLHLSLPLGSIEPGLYDCQVSVLDGTARKAAFWRGTIVVVP